MILNNSDLLNAIGGYAQNYVRLGALRIPLMFLKSALFYGSLSQRIISLISNK